MKTLADVLFGQFSLLQYAEFLIRLIVSCLCGAAIGYERTKRLKEAGVRTHIIVCCAAALMMIVSKYGFSDLAAGNGILIGGDRGADPSRIASQIVSGVSFLGAGIIFRNGSSVRGLTTAAGIWATAGIGLAIGSGMYVIGLAGTLIIAVIQIIMHRHAIGADAMISGEICCKTTRPEAFRQSLEAYAQKNRMQVSATKITFNEDGSQTYHFTLRMNMETTINDLVTFLETSEDAHMISCEIEK